MPDDQITPHYDANNNFALDQISAFLAGGIGEHTGGFMQFTYSNIPNASHLDNTDLRPYTTTFDLGGNELRVGTTINNNPTVQDPYNSTFAWGYPYVASGLAPTPAASPILASGFNNNSIGYTVYAWYDHSLYLEAGVYTTLSPWSLAASAMTSVSAVRRARCPICAPPMNGTGTPRRCMSARSTCSPMSIRSSGVFQTDGSMGRDHYSDYAFDASYQYLGDGTHIVTAQGIFTHEDQNLEGTTAASMQQRHDVRTEIEPQPDPDERLLLVPEHLWPDARLAEHLGTGQSGAVCTGVDLTGSANSKPNSNAFIIEADWVPFGKPDFVAVALGQPEAGHPVHRLYAVQRRQQELRRLRPQRQRQQHAVPVRLDGVLTSFAAAMRTLLFEGREIGNQVGALRVILQAGISHSSARHDGLGRREIFFERRFDPR